MGSPLHALCLLRCMGSSAPPRGTGHRFFCSACRAQPALPWPAGQTAGWHDASPTAHLSAYPSCPPTCSQPAAPRAEATGQNKAFVLSSPNGKKTKKQKQKKTHTSPCSSEPFGVCSMRAVPCLPRRTPAVVLAKGRRLQSCRHGPGHEPNPSPAVQARASRFPTPAGTSAWCITETACVQPHLSSQQLPRGVRLRRQQPHLADLIIGAWRVGGVGGRPSTGMSSGVGPKSSMCCT